MKTARILGATLLLFATILFSNCTPDYDFPPTTREIITNGNWKVDFYYSGGDRTDQYLNYEFSFRNDGSITCTHGSSNCSGLWNVARDGEGKEVLEVLLNTPDPSLKKLAMDWEVSGTEPGLLNMQTDRSDKLRLRQL